MNSCLSNPPSDCNCHLSVLQVLMQIEELKEDIIPFETLLGLVERAQSDFIMVLNCHTCRRKRFAVILITIVSGSLVEWLEKYCSANGLCRATDETVAAGSSSSDRPQTAKISFGDYDLDESESRVLTRELISLRLKHFSGVITPVQTAIANLQSAQDDGRVDTSKAVSTCMGATDSNIQRLTGLIRALDLVKSSGEGKVGSQYLRQGFSQMQ